jgi:hypothetical protein
VDFSARVKKETAGHDTPAVGLSGLATSIIYVTIIEPVTTTTFPEAR